ncbi:MAG: hypothetical protein GDA36_09665 [Rhodobacteraceae bacterium]|nr:hypothetical protein [Paracoccaceae bacterium]
MTARVQLYVDQPMAAGQTVPASRDQGALTVRRLFGVMRLRNGRGRGAPQAKPQQNARAGYRAGYPTRSQGHQILRVDMAAVSGGGHIRCQRLH